MLYGVIILALIRSSHGQWGYNPYAVGGFGIAPPPPPNTNVGVGYPTAYGLSLGRGNSNVAPPSPSLSSSVRCLNGGAHIGQCRLDNDAICTALGGGCVHGACCTTPFIGLTTGATTGPEVDGEVTRKPKKHITRETPAEERRMTTVSILERAELQRLLENAKSTVIPDSDESPYSRVSKKPLLFNRKCLNT
ncbi:unnamed protein product [Cylicocyclus nassatus]|uniref:Uncharacterized protein n=1 Tax=Cylicocyclus nassatus TaxID=53992 RepID=A0AA36DRP1_CYLNA|nr:unnamed protein product [Cylicocyclus nassatus]